MKLLLDANLSWRMIQMLEKSFAACLHVDRIEKLKVPATDIEIWTYAKTNDLIIVTNDDDFVDLMVLKGFPPKIVLLKTGNQNRTFVCNILISRKPEIEMLYFSNDTGLLEILA